jgi:hypothetical protein
MVCGTCGKAGHNTTTCPNRKLATGVAKVGGYLGGAAAGAHFGVPGGGTAGKAVAGAGANALLKTDGQKHYEKYGKKK